MFASWPALSRTSVTGSFVEREIRRGLTVVTAGAFHHKHLAGPRILAVHLRMGAGLESGMESLAEGRVIAGHIDHAAVDHSVGVVLGRSRVVVVRSLAAVVRNLAEVAGRRTGRSQVAGRRVVAGDSLPVGCSLQAGCVGCIDCSLT